MESGFGGYEISLNSDFLITKLLFFELSESVIYSQDVYD